MEERVSTKYRMSRLGLIPGLGVIALLRSITRAQQEQDHPTAVTYTKRSRGLENLALRLASEAREDQDAVKELLIAAKHRRAELRRAAAAIRFMGWANDSAQHDRANRLLLAAANRQPITALTSERKEWFDTLQSLRDGPLDVGYDYLANIQPALRDLADQVRDMAAASDRLPEESRKQALWELFAERLNPLAGPEAKDARDPLLRTRTAHGLADRYLSLAAGLPDPAKDASVGV